MYLGHVRTMTHESFGMDDMCCPWTELFPRHRMREGMELVERRWTCPLGEDSSTENWSRTLHRFVKKKVLNAKIDLERM